MDPVEEHAPEAPAAREAVRSARAALDPDIYDPRIELFPDQLGVDVSLIDDDLRRRFEATDRRRSRSRRSCTSTTSARPGHHRAGPAARRASARVPAVPVAPIGRGVPHGADDATFAAVDRYADSALPEHTKAALA